MGKPKEVIQGYIPVSAIPVSLRILAKRSPRIDRDPVQAVTIPNLSAVSYCFGHAKP
jgi:hypothetical protein